MDRDELRGRTVHRDPRVPGGRQGGPESPTGARQDGCALDELHLGEDGGVRAVTARSPPDSRRSEVLVSWPGTRTASQPAEAEDAGRHRDEHVPAASARPGAGPDTGRWLSHPPPFGTGTAGPGHPARCPRRQPPSPVQRRSSSLFRGLRRSPPDTGSCNSRSRHNSRGQNPRYFQDWRCAQPCALRVNGVTTTGCRPERVRGPRRRRS